MNLSEFLAILDSGLSYLVKSGSGSGKITGKDKLVTYLTAFILPPNDENPIEELSEDFGGRIFSGRKQLTNECCTFLLDNIDSAEFSNFCQNTTIEAKTTMVKSFSDSNENVILEHFEENLTSILQKIVSNISKRKYSGDIHKVTFLPDNKVKIGAKTITLPEDLAATETLNPIESIYVDALLRVYTQHEANPNMTFTDIKSLTPFYSEHLQIQREFFFSAESALHKVRDFDNGVTEFEVLKKELFDGIRMDKFSPHKDALELVNKTLHHVTVLSFSQSYLARNNNGLIGNSEKQGIVHILVNDGIITWEVDKDGTV